MHNNLEQSIMVMKKEKTRIEGWRWWWWWWWWFSSFLLHSNKQHTIQCTAQYSTQCTITVTHGAQQAVLEEDSTFAIVCFKQHNRWHNITTWSDQHPMLDKSRLPEHGLFMYYSGLNVEVHLATASCLFPAWSAQKSSQQPLLSMCGTILCIVCIQKNVNPDS